MLISLRPATWDDAELLLEWKNEETMRRFSIKTNELIELEDHYNWLGQHLDEILIIEYDGVPCGDIRVEGDEVAIKLDPAYRGKGIGRFALFYVQTLHKRLVAKIVHGNVASMRLFQGNGFQVTGLGDNYYVLTWER